MPANVLKESPLATMMLCGYCGKEIIWYRYNGGKLPVNFETSTRGVFEIGANKTLVRATNVIPGMKYFRSHFLDCKPLALAYANRNKINPTMGAPVIPCEREDCKRLDKHFHCFKCGSTEHFAKDCDSEESNDGF